MRRLTKNHDIIILKLGGSLLTDKNKPFSLRKEKIKDAVQQIIDANVKLILIHGGGSFGHPLAKKYKITEGVNKEIPEQIKGLSETHHSMTNLNSYLVDLFLEKKYPVFSIQTSSIFFIKSNQVHVNSINVIETALDLGILPILYGDIILKEEESFSIISGDEIIFELCDNLKKYNISKVIFTMETDGIYITTKNQKSEPILLEECYCEELEALDLAEMGQKIDVTKGIKGKINFIKKICEKRIPVQLVNGLENGYIYGSLKNQEIRSTNITHKV